MRYHLLMYEGQHRIPCGKPFGYDTPDEAKAAALAHVDDAMPHNTVHVIQSLGHAYFGGDGDSHWHEYKTE